MGKFKRMHLVAVVMLTLFLSMMIATMSNTVHAAEELAPQTDAVPEGTLIESENVNAAVLAWMANEKQMSIDPTDAPQGLIPDFTCTEPPHDCPAKTHCPWLASGGAWCTITSCGLGSCPICPGIFPNLVVKSWCAYGCMKGKDMVGGAFMINSRFGWVGPMCIPA